MIRALHFNDKPEIIQLLKLNTPSFFDPSEEKDLMEYLEKSAQNYYVMEEDNKIIGAGGINYGFDNGKTARISWDLIHPDFQGKGIGTKLLQYRLAKIKQKDFHKIVVRTTQLVHKFYENNGFKLERVIEDYWAKGFDLYQMKMELEKS